MADKTTKIDPTSMLMGWRIGQMVAETESE
jgi:hypothetical protein